VILDTTVSNAGCVGVKNYEPRNNDVFSVFAVVQTIQDAEFDLGFVLPIVLNLCLEQADLASQCSDIFWSLGHGDLYVGGYLLLNIQR